MANLRRRPDSMAYVPEIFTPNKNDLIGISEGHANKEKKRTTTIPEISYTIQVRRRDGITFVQNPEGFRNIFSSMR